METTSSKHRINTREVAIHLLFWMGYILSEYLADLMHMQPGQHLRFFRAIILSLPPLIFATYFLALYVVPRFLQPGRWLGFLLWILVVAVLVFYARIKWLELINYLQNDQYYRVPASKVVKNVIRDYAIIALAVCIYIIGDYRKKQKLNEALVKAKAEAEIKLLKGQLHPHFLFNSLNNIYSLALMKSDLTADSILKLTELLDYLVYRAGKKKVALAKEVQLLENYTGLEQLRYGERLQVNSDLQIERDGIEVAPLLLLPFAENCFKHGGVGKDGVFRIDIHLHADRKKLVFRIANSKKNGRAVAPQAGGIGLQNIRKRLNLLYPGRHQLIIEDHPDQYLVRMEIKL